jgi:malate synthase
MADVRLSAAPVPRGDEVLTEEALAFVAELQRRFGTRRDELLARRARRRQEVARTGRLDFLPQTENVRSGQWTVATAPPDLVDRRVEIPGPTETKVAATALNSGAKVWLADLEDANTPHWKNVVTGQVVLADSGGQRDLPRRRGDDPADAGDALPASGSRSLLNR